MKNQTGMPKNARLTLKAVTIPVEHDGFYSRKVILKWVCPVCGQPRGEPYVTHAYDGSRRLPCHGWVNPCGHIDKYSAVQKEADENPYN